MTSAAVMDLVFCTLVKVYMLGNPMHMNMHEILKCWLKRNLWVVYFRYTPSQQGVAFNSGAKQRVIRMVEMQKDPMEPPRFKWVPGMYGSCQKELGDGDIKALILYFSNIRINKKIPRGPPSPPAPVMHSPSRKVRAFYCRLLFLCLMNMLLPAKGSPKSWPRGIVLMVSILASLPNLFSLYQTSCWTIFWSLLFLYVPWFVFYLLGEVRWGLQKHRLLLVFWRSLQGHGEVSVNWLEWGRKSMDVSSLGLRKLTCRNVCISLRHLWKKNLLSRF